MNFSSFFSKVQETPWYGAFLNPVINEIENPGKLLDIGTGSGKLIQILTTEYGIDCVGVDTSQEMLDEATKKLRHIKTELIKIVPNQKLPFGNGSFDYITICSVLFHLKEEDIDRMIKDSRRLLKKGGKIIVLTPTGGGNFIKLTRYFPSIKNRSIYIWYLATKKRAKAWTKTKYLRQYAKENKLQYKSEIVMNGFAQLEVVV